jgi:hypothetical protein
MIFFFNLAEWNMLCSSIKNEGLGVRNLVILMKIWWINGCFGEEVSWH